MSPRPAQFTVDSVSRERMQTLDGHQIMSGVVRLVGTTHDAAVVGAQLGRHVLVLPAPCGAPATLAERLLRATAVVLELGIEPEDVNLRTDGAGPDRIQLRLSDLEHLIDARELDWRARPLTTQGLAEVVGQFRGVELVAVAFGADADRWLRLFDGDLGSVEPDPVGATP